MVAISAEVFLFSGKSVANGVLTFNSWLVLIAAYMSQVSLSLSSEKD